MVDRRYDREMARAFVEAGYMSLRDYIDLYGPMIEAEHRQKMSFVQRWMERINRRVGYAQATEGSSA